MPGPEQFAPPVYACAAGSVLHGHAGDTLEPGVLLYTFLPPGAADDLRTTEPRVDVHADGPGAATVTVRVLAGETALSWQLPLVPFVAALPGQSGDDGRMVLLAVVDEEPAADFWASAIDCSRLSAELQLPVADLVEALHGRLTPWLADDLQLLLHDDAHDRAVDRTPAQTLSEALLAEYRGDLAAEQTTGRLLRALTMAPPAYSVQLGAQLAAALVAVLEQASGGVIDAVVAETGPFETEVLRLLTDLPRLLQDTPPAGRVEAALVALVEGDDRDETVRGAVSVVGRLARSVFGPDLPDDQLLQRLGVVDDLGTLRLADLWVSMATAAGGDPAGDAVAARALLDQVLAEARPAEEWLRATARTLVVLTREAGRTAEKVAEPLAVVAGLADGLDEPTAIGIEACLVLARFVRRQRRVGPGDWLHGPPGAAVAALLARYDEGMDVEAVIDLLSELVEDDVGGIDVLEALICATAQVLVQVDTATDDALRQLQVNELLTGLPDGPRGGRWLLTACLREAHDHDAGALDLTPFLAREPALDPDRAADKAGRAGMLRMGLRCMEALATVLGEEAQLSRGDVLCAVLPTALVEHELLPPAY